MANTHDLSRDVRPTGPLPHEIDKWNLEIVFVGRNGREIIRTDRFDDLNLDQLAWGSINKTMNSMTVGMTDGAGAQRPPNCRNDCDHCTASARISAPT